MANTASAQSRAKKSTGITPKESVKVRSTPSSKPEFVPSNKPQRWISKYGGVTYVMKNPIPVSWRSPDGKEFINDTIIYSEGASSIWLSQLGGNNANIVRTPIHYRNNVLDVGEENVLLQEFLWAAVTFGKVVDVYLEDLEADATQELENRLLRGDNEQIVFKSSLNYKKAVWSALGGIIEPSASDKALTARILKENDKNPQRVYNILHRENVEIEWVCQQMLEKGFVTNQGDQVIWVGPNKDLSSFIMNVTPGQLNKDVLANNMLVDKEFKSKWLELFTNALGE